MLRVGLTGDLGSGKSTVARMLAERGAVIFSSDEIGRRLMEPDRGVYARIVAHFGPGILAPDHTIDRRKLASIAFDPRNPRIEELNEIVHPAVLRVQAAELEELAARHPQAIAVVESALIFSTRHAPEGTWRSRFDKILLVTAPEDTKIQRFIDRAAAGRDLTPDDRSALEADAHRRLALQHTTPIPPGDAILLHNDGDIDQLEAQVEVVWQKLYAAATYDPDAPWRPDDPS
jgi:dephospho-CoA kinase